MVDTPTVIYVRDTAATDSAATQRELALDYATQELDLDPDDVAILSDTAMKARTASTSSDQELFNLARGGDIERVLVYDASRIATDIRDLSDRIRRLVDNDVAVHLISPGLQLGESEADAEDTVDDDSMLQALEIAAELEASVNSKRTSEGIAAAQAAGKHTGRPPFGFDSDGDGTLIPNENFETALAVIEQTEAGESKRSIAREANITRATVRSILDRKERYQTR